MTKDKFTVDMVKPLREKLGMTQQELADAIGAGIRTVAGWESTKENAPKKIIRSLRMNLIELQRKADKR